MAITVASYAKATISSAPSATTSSSFTPSSNTALFIIIGQSSGNSSITSITDSLGGSWTSLYSNAAANPKTYLFARSAFPSGAAMTVTLNSGGNVLGLTYIVVGATGQPSAGSISSATSSNGTSAFIAVTTTAAAQVGDAYISFLFERGISTPTWTPGSGFTLLDSSAAGATNTLAVQYQIATGATTVTSTATVTGGTTTEARQAVITSFSTPLFTGWGGPI